MSDVLNKLKQSTLNGNVKSNGFLNNTMTVTASLIASKTQVPIDVIDDKKENVVDEEEIVLPEYEKVKVVGRGSFLFLFVLILKSKENIFHSAKKVHLVLQFYT